jgi:hypothetical protein
MKSNSSEKENKRKCLLFVPKHGQSFTICADYQKGLLTVYLPFFPFFFFFGYDGI